MKIYDQADAQSTIQSVPSIIIPHWADPLYWERTLHKIGVAPKPLHHQDMTPKRLAKRINQVISSQAMAERARALRERIEAEDGLTTAVRLIEAFATEVCLNYHYTS